MYVNTALDCTLKKHKVSLAELEGVCIFASGLNDLWHIVLGMAVRG